MKKDIKKLIILNLPFVAVGYLGDKIGWLFRTAPVDTVGNRIIYTVMYFGKAFQNFLPSFHPADLLIGVGAALALKGALYMKHKNAKKFRQGVEYGSARWGTPEDIKPFMDDKPDQNIILTQTEALTMNSRPKNPKYARNKNVLVIGGSGSGKTRFFVKPNLMQLHSSYVLTDPKITASVILNPRKHGFLVFPRVFTSHRKEAKSP